MPLGARQHLYLSQTLTIVPVRLILDPNDMTLVNM
jgi:hypothetical protein